MARLTLPASGGYPNGPRQPAADAPLYRQGVRKGGAAGADERRAARPDPAAGGGAGDVAVGIDPSDALDRTDRGPAPGPALAGAAGPEAGGGRQCRPGGGGSGRPGDRGMERDDAGRFLPGPPRRGLERRGSLRETLRRLGP